MRRRRVLIRGAIEALQPGDRGTGPVSWRQWTAGVGDVAHFGLPWGPPCLYVAVGVGWSAAEDPAAVSLVPSVHPEEDEA